MFAASGGAVSDDKTYIEDVFSTYLYTGNGSTQTINNGLAIGTNTSAWSTYKVTSGRTWARDVCTDASDNVITVGSVIQTSDSTQYAYVVKQNAAGSIVWQKQFLFGTFSFCNGVCTDSAGNIYITGQAWDGTSSNTCLFVAKLDSSGSIQWQRKALRNGAATQGNRVTVDSSGNVYVAGELGWNGGMSVLKYDSTGTLLWQKHLRETGTCAAKDVAVDSSGNVYVVGTSQIFIDPTTYNYLIVAKYDSSGTLLHQKMLKPPVSGTQTYADGNGITIDSSGNIYVVGSVYDGATWSLLAKYNSSGSFDWQVKHKVGGSANSIAKSVSVDTSGNIYVVGSTTSGTPTYAFLTKFDTNGTILWERLASDFNTQGHGVATDTIGNVYFSGQAYTDGNTNDYWFTIKMPQTGGAKAGTAFLTLKTSTSSSTSAGASVTNAASSDPATPFTESTVTLSVASGTATLTTQTQDVQTGNSDAMVWTKSRSNAIGNIIVDTVRGGTNALITNLTNANSADSGYHISSFNSNGYSLQGAGSGDNTNNYTYVSWTFRKAPKFFDVVTYTGNYSERTISHSLGQAPGMVIIKSTSNARDWYVWHRSGTQINTYGAKLNLTDAYQNYGAQMWGNALSGTPDMNASTFRIGAFSGVNWSGETYVAYLFAHDTTTDGLIQCGSFTGPATVNLGWEPQYIMFKRTDGAQDWYVMDTMRGIGASGDYSYLNTNTSNAEGSASGGPTISATGFTWPSAGASYIYMAIRRGPMRTPTDATKVFSINYQGNPNNINIPVSSIGFQPDAFYERSRNGGSGNPTGYGYRFMDRLRRIGSALSESSPGLPTISTSAENSYAFGTSGTSYGTASGGWSGYDLIYYMLRRAPGFFDEVCYTGTGATQTVNHNLGVAPELTIIKRRDASSTYGWHVWCKLASNSPGYPGSGKALLNSTEPYYAGDSMFTPTQAPTSSSLSLANVPTDVNGNGGKFVAYLFASCPGVSKVGSYTGNGTNQTINCGFAAGARFVMIKRTDSTGDWYVWDTARGIVSSTDPHLSLNTTAAEVTTDDTIDPDSTGFIVNQVAATDVNVNAATYIYLAIA